MAAGDITFEMNRSLLQGFAVILTEQSTVHEGLVAGEYQDLRLSSSGIMASCVDVCYMRIASLSTCMKPRDFLVNRQR